MPIAYAVARISARAFVGEDLAHNDEWVRLCIQITGDTMAAARELRKRYYKDFRWLARWFLPGAQKVLQMRRRAAQLLTPQVQDALANPDATEPNGIQWYISRLTARKKTLDIQQLADDNMFIAIASVHATSSTILSMLYDLIDRPDDRQEIMDEIRNVWAEEENGTWSKTGLMKLEKLDSFMKESQRFHPLGMGKILSLRTRHKGYTEKWLGIK
jgi:ent-kaurene oxidase